MSRVALSGQHGTYTPAGGLTDCLESALDRDDIVTTVGLLLSATRPDLARLPGELVERLRAADDANVARAVHRVFGD